MNSIRIYLQYEFIRAAIREYPANHEYTHWQQMD